MKSRGTSLFATGNNIVLVGDVTRRAIAVRLDANAERPELRDFQGDPFARVMQNRGAYIAAALTVCRAYVVAGQPGARSLASFAGWSKLVRSALMWLGKGDCVEAMETARAIDPELVAFRDVLKAWAEVMGVGKQYRCRLSDLIEAAADAPELEAALDAAAGAVDARSVGNWARHKRDRMIDGLRLVCLSDPKGGSLWWVEAVDGRERPPARAWERVTVRATIAKETKKAVLLSEYEVWLPKSAITIAQRAEGDYEVTLPAWLAREKNIRPEVAEIDDGGCLI